MKKNKMIAVVAAVALIGAIGIGSTLAYFTDSASQTNTVTFGHVDIDLEEPEFSKNDDYTITDVAPGQVITKDPTITVADDSLDCYVRAKVEINGELTDAQKAELFESIIETVVDVELWSYNEEDGYFYYGGELTPGESVTLFESVTIPTTWNNSVADATFTIDVTAEAVQADYLADDDVTKNGEAVIGWGNFDVKEYGNNQ
jgi:predicted ribosomally synthesized peptide with SipW-like signal peptide